MAITSLDNVVAAFASAQQRRTFYKVSQPSAAVGRWYTLWLVTGQPAAGLAASSVLVGEIPTSATLGAIPFMDAGGGAVSYLGRLSAHNGLAGGNVTALSSTMLLADRLWQTKAPGNITTLQTVTSSPPLTRPDSTGADNELWVEINGNQTSAAVLTVNYTDQTGAAKTTSGHLLATGAYLYQAFQIPLAAGSMGVRSIQSIQLNAAMTASTGPVMGLVIMRRLAEINVPGLSCGTTLDLFSTGLPIIDPSACLYFLMCNGNNAAAQMGDYRGSLSIIQG